jgi:hypothetical protein
MAYPPNDTRLGEISPEGLAFSTSDTSADADVTPSDSSSFHYASSSLRSALHAPESAAVDSLDDFAQDLSAPHNQRDLHSRPAFRSESETEGSSPTGTVSADRNDDGTASIQYLVDLVLNRRHATSDGHDQHASESSSAQVVGSSTSRLAEHDRTGDDFRAVAPAPSSAGETPEPDEIYPLDTELRTVPGRSEDPPRLSSALRPRSPVRGLDDQGQIPRLSSSLTVSAE